MSFKILKSIIAGFGNYAFPSDTFEEMALVRAKQCSKCPHANPKHRFQLFKDNKLTDIEGLGCDLCGCLISAKIRSPFEMCPDTIRKW